MIAFVLTTITTPAGVPGAVLLRLAEVSVLHGPNPAVTGLDGICGSCLGARLQP